MCRPPTHSLATFLGKLSAHRPILSDSAFERVKLCIIEVRACAGGIHDIANRPGSDGGRHDSQPRLLRRGRGPSRNCRTLRIEYGIDIRPRYVNISYGICHTISSNSIVTQPATCSTG